MALPIMIFGILLVIALALFLFGASRESMNSGFGFILLAAIIIIVTGLFVWSSGLQLETPASIDTTNSIITITYETQQATNGSPLWVICNTFVFGGLGLILLAFVLTVKQRRETSFEQQVINS
jgi:RsiW-degrading membrane proteinase PrsW (M82 family)